MKNVINIWAMQPISLTFTSGFPALTLQLYHKISFRYAVHYSKYSNNELKELKGATQTTIISFQILNKLHYNFINGYSVENEDARWSPNFIPVFKLSMDAATAQLTINSKIYR